MRADNVPCRDRHLGEHDLGRERALGRVESGGRVGHFEKRTTQGGKEGEGVEYREGTRRREG